MLSVTRTIKINAKDLTTILSEALNLPPSMKLEFDLHTEYSDPREMCGTQRCESITLTYTEPIEELKKMRYQ